MDTLHLSPKARVQTPEALRWVIVAMSFLLAAATWWVSDLWRLATWPKHQIEMDGAMPAHKLASLALFALSLVICFAIAITAAVTQNWYWYEYFTAGFVLTFLYSVATGIRLL